MPMSPLKGVPLFTNELITTVWGCEVLKLLSSAPLSVTEPPSLNMSWGEPSKSPRSISGYLPLLGCARMAVTARLKAKAFPAKIHVEKAILVKAIGHPGVSRSSVGGAPLKVNGTAIQQLLPQYAGKATWALHSPRHVCRSIVKVLLQGLVCKKPLCAA